MLRSRSLICSVLLVVCAGAFLFFGTYTEAQRAGRRSAESTSGVAAANLKADYQFQNTYASSIAGAPNLTPTAAGQTFATDTVDGAPRTVLQFPLGAGLLSSTTGVIPNDTYTVLIKFRYETTSNSFYRHILDFGNGAAFGLYIHNNSLKFYGSPVEQAGATPVVTGTYYQVAITRTTGGVVKGYVNGILQWTFTDSTNASLISAANTLKFFKDDGNEDTAGSVARIRLYDDALTAGEILAINEMNARNEFSLTQGGTTGVWNYGYSNSATDNTFTLFTETQTNAQCGDNVFRDWFRTGEPFSLPVIRSNTGTVPCTQPRFDMLNLHPSDSGRRSVLRWTAPAAGTFLVSGVFQGLDSGGGAGGTTTDVKIIKNNTDTLFSGNVVGYNAQQPFSLTVTVTQGEWLDFSVGYGTNSEEFDSTGLALTIGPPVTACQLAPANLAVHLPAENSTADVIGSNFNGSLVGDAKYTNSGKVGRAFSFDGVGDVVSLADKDNQDITGDITIEAWVNPTGVAGDQIIVDKRDYTGANANYVLYLSNGALTFTSRLGTGTFNTVSAPGAIPAGAYTHVAAVISGTDIILYRNGVETHRAAYNFTRPTSTGQLQLGGTILNGFAGSYFNGLIDEVSIYNRALSQTELFDIVQQGSFGKCSTTCAQPPSGMVSWWQGENNALDARSNNHGTVQGGITYAAGRAGQTFRLAGTGDASGNGDRVNVGNPGNLQLQDFTIEAWIRRASSTVVTNSPIGTPGGTFFAYGQNGYGFLVDQATGRLGLTNIGNTVVFSTATVTDTDFHHVVVTKLGNQVIFYVDGVANAPVTYNTTFSFTTNAAIGARGDNDVRNAFFGDIDELKIYNRPLSAAEIQSIYNAGQSGVCRPIGLNAPANMSAWYSGSPRNGTNAPRDVLELNPDGILRGNAGYAVGKVDQAFTLDGNGDYIEVPDDPDHRPANDLTIEGWFNLRSLPGGSDIHLVSKPLTGSDSNSYVIWFDGQIRAGHGNQSGGFETLLTGFVPNLDTWYHFAYTLDDAGNTHRFFVNGSEVASAASTLPLFYDATPHPLLIGAEYGPPGTPYSFANGRIDDVSLYSRALSASEVAAIYQSQDAGKVKTATVLSPGANGVAYQLSDATVVFPAGVVTGGTVTETGLDLGLLPPLPPTALFTGLAYDISTTATTPANANAVQVCFNVPSLSATPASQLRIYHLENNVWVDRTSTGAQSYSALCTTGMTSLSPFVIVRRVLTASEVSISGRVATSGGRGITGAIVRLTDAYGKVSAVTTTRSGAYRFSGVASGQTVMLDVVSKRFGFADAPRFITLGDNVTNADFTGLR